MGEFTNEFVINLGLKKAVRHIYNYYNSSCFGPILETFKEENEKYYLTFNDKASARGMSSFIVSKINDNASKVVFKYNKLMGAKNMCEYISKEIISNTGKLFTKTLEMPFNCDNLSFDQFKKCVMEFSIAKAKYIVKDLEESHIMIDQLKKCINESIDDINVIEESLVDTIKNEGLDKVINVDEKITYDKYDVLEYVSKYVNAFCITRLYELYGKDIKKVQKGITSFLDILTYNYMTKKTNNVDYYDILYNIDFKKQNFYAKSRIDNLFSAQTALLKFEATLFFLPIVATAGIVKTVKDAKNKKEVPIVIEPLEKPQWVIRTKKETICKVIKYSNSLTKDIIYSEYLEDYNPF